MIVYWLDTNKQIFGLSKCRNYVLISFNYVSLFLFYFHPGIELKKDKYPQINIYDDICCGTITLESGLLWQKGPQMLRFHSKAKTIILLSILS